MKANFKYALMAAAALCMVACGGNEPENPKDEDPDDEEPTQFVSKVNVKDGSIAEWDNLPAAYVASASCPANALFKDLKTVKVYADQLYVNYYFEFDADAFTADDLAWTPVHIYFDADNDAKTGGYNTEFADQSAEFMLEGAIFSGGEPIDFNPAVFQWFGLNGGGITDQTVDPTTGLDGWSWTDPKRPNDEADKWGAIVATGELPIGESQLVGKNIIEGHILRELIPYKFNDKEFNIGFDIQKNWSTSGILPQGDADENGAQGRVNKLNVKIDMAD